MHPAKVTRGNTRSSCKSKGFIFKARLSEADHNPNQPQHNTQLGNINAQYHGRENSSLPFLLCLYSRNCHPPSCHYCLFATSNCHSRSMSCHCRFFFGKCHSLHVASVSCRFFLSVFCCLSYCFPLQQRRKKMWRGNDGLIPISALNQSHPFPCCSTSDVCF